jgi:hypothetical protein
MNISLEDSQQRFHTFRIHVSRPVHPPTKSHMWQGSEIMNDLLHLL